MKQLRTVLVAALLFGGSATTSWADSFFWAVNQFDTIQRINGDTGAVVDSFALGTGTLEASIAVVGNIGYYTILGDANVYRVDMTTHAHLGVAFNTGNSAFMNGITNDAAGNLYFAHGSSGAGNVLQGFTTAGAPIGTWTFPTASSSYRDGSVVFGNIVVANRGDQIGPYDKYMMVGNSLVYVNQPFIIDPISNSGNNGIGFNGVNYYVANEQRHVVMKYDINGNFVSSANLAANSRYENWTFASQDIVAPGVPEPASLVLLGTGVLGLMRTVRRRNKNQKNSHGDPVITV
jgi:PEP-CTERM motif-containing protein